MTGFILNFLLQCWIPSKNRSSLTIDLVIDYLSRLQTMLVRVKILTNTSVAENLLTVLVLWYENQRRPFVILYSLSRQLDISEEMFTGVTPSKDTFLNQARNARELRHNAKFENECAIRIQKVIRGWLHRQKLARLIRLYLDELAVSMVLIILMYFLLICVRSDFDILFVNNDQLSSIQAFNASKRIIATFSLSKDNERFEIYCRYYTFPLLEI